MKNEIEVMRGNMMSLSVSIYIISSFFVFRKGGVEKFEKNLKNLQYISAIRAPTLSRKSKVKANAYVHECSLDISALI